MNDIKQENNGPDFYPPREIQLRPPVSAACAHCGRTFRARTATIFCWPDRTAMPMQGYVASCDRCGSRIQLTPPAKTPVETPVKTKTPPPVKRNQLPLLLLALLLLAFLGAGGSALKHMLPSMPEKTPASVSNVEKTGNESEGSSEESSVDSSEGFSEDSSEEEAYRCAFDGLMPVSEDNIWVDTLWGANVSSKFPFQGIEWDTDTMESAFYSYGNMIVKQSVEGDILDSREAEESRYAGIDYYNNKLFVARTKSTSKGDCYVLILNADNLDDRIYTKLSDMDALREEYMERYGKVKIIIDGITIAPDFEDRESLKVYVSFGVWMTEDKENQLSLLDKQIIKQYDYNTLMKQAENLEPVTAERTLYVDLGPITFGGIQTLEYDRDTGNIWCAVRSSGYEDTLFELFLPSGADEFDIVSSYSMDSASDGFTSIGSHYYSDVELEYDGVRTSHTEMEPTIRVFRIEE